MKTALKEQIIVPAWEIIQNHSSLKKFYFFPGLLSIIFLSVLLVYQSIYTYVVIFGYKRQALEVILDFFHSSYALEVIIGGIIFFIIYAIVSPICEGAMIKYVNATDNNKNMAISEAVGVGFYKFLPVFEYNNIFSQFKFISIVNAYLFLIRFLGLEHIAAISYLFLFLFCISMIITILFSYAKYFIVLENYKVFESVGASSKLAMFNFSTTARLYFLMFFLNVRVIFNFLIFLIFPILMVAAVGFITSQIYLTIAIIILSAIFCLLILALGYLAAVLDIFKTSLWYFAYKQGKQKGVEISDNTQKNTQD